MPGNELKNFMEEGKEVVVKSDMDLLQEKLVAEQSARVTLEDRLAVIEVEKENYKTVALKRKGKLENDDNFFGEHDEQDIEKKVASDAERIKAELEAARKLQESEARSAKLERDLSEIKTALDHKPASGLGASSGGGQEVKDSVFSEAQETALKQRWTSRGFNEDQQKRMLETEKRNALARRTP